MRLKTFTPKQKLDVFTGFLHDDPIFAEYIEGQITAEYDECMNFLKLWKIENPFSETTMAEESFVDLYLDYTKELESSTAFFRWSAYACIAALLRDNVFLPDGPGSIYPNIYVLLLANSAMHRKARGPDLTSQILEEISNTKIIRGRTSIQSVIDDLGKLGASPKSGKPIKGGSCIMIADELASFIVSDPAAISILTDIYDFRKVWVSSLKGTGKTTINNLCVTMLSASNEEHLKAVYTEAAVYGGLLGRTFFIKPNEYRPGNPLFGGNMNGQYNLKPLFTQAHKIAALKGEMKVDPAAQKTYEDWYMPWRKSCEKTTDRTGVYGRIHTSIKKIAMILCIGQTYDLIIRRNHVEEAIDHCMNLIPNYTSYAISTGKSTLAAAGAVLLGAMYDRPDKSTTKREFLFANWTTITPKILDEVIASFEHIKLISITPTRDGDVSIMMTKHGIALFAAKFQQVSADAKVKAAEVKRQGK